MGIDDDLDAEEDGKIFSNLAVVPKIANVNDFDNQLSSLAFGNGLMMDDIVNQMEMGDDGNDGDDFDDEANLETPMGPTPQMPKQQQEENNYDDMQLEEGNYHKQPKQNNNNPLMMDDDDMKQKPPPPPAKG